MPPLCHNSAHLESEVELATRTHDDPTVPYSKGKVTQIVDQATTTKFAYDQLGRTTQTQRLVLGVWQTMAQSYDALNRIISETFPDSETVTYTYNEAGWLSTVPGYINGITYNARGQKTALTYANNLTTTWTFDANSFRVTNRATSSNQQNLTYGYDPAGNITSITDSLFTASRTFAYDDLNRLITGNGTFGANQAQQNCSYSYNAIGNLTNKCGTVFTYGDAMHPSAVTYNPLSGRNYTYDANGNMLTRGNQTLTWDIDNRVSSIAISGGGTTLMEYDSTGIRFKKNAPSGISYFPFQGYEIDPSGTKSKFIRIGIETFASKQTTSGGASTQYFYHNDHLGGVNVITDSTGLRVQLNEYEPWGGVSRTSGSIDPTHRFNGKELDPESGLYYYGGRYYDAEISRFISADPYVQSPDDPQNLNRFTYVINNPQNYIDPSGYSFWKFLKKAFFWHHRIVTNMTLAHLAPHLVAVRELSRGVARQIFYGIERVVVTAVVSFFTLNPAIGAAAGAAFYAAEMGGDPLQVLKAGANGFFGAGGFGAGFAGSGGGIGSDATTVYVTNVCCSNLGGAGAFGKVSGKDDSGSFELAMGPRGIVPRRPWHITNPRVSGMPKPPGWTQDWTWDYSPFQSSPKSGPRWLDTQGAEWRWHGPDKWHKTGHWDYNPRNAPNSAWRNVPHTGETFPSVVPGYPIPELIPDSRA